MISFSFFQNFMSLFRNLSSFPEIFVYHTINYNKPVILSVSQFISSKNDLNYLTGKANAPDHTEPVMIFHLTRALFH